jgi:type IV pilus assembly protein PilP
MGVSADHAGGSMLVAQASQAAPAPSVGVAPQAAPSAQEPALPNASGGGGYSYDPSQRRDPFKPVGIESQQPGEENLDLPPLMRAPLTELNVIAIVWGGFGYTAMVQTPDGKGYTVRKGTKIGPNNGVVSAITESAVIVQEHYTDVYGKKQVREYIKRLREKERAP